MAPKCLAARKADVCVRQPRWSADCGGDTRGRLASFTPAGRPLRVALTRKRFCEAPVREALNGECSQRRHRDREIASHNSARGHGRKDRRSQRRRSNWPPRPLCLFRPSDTQHGRELHSPGIAKPSDAPGHRRRRAALHLHLRRGRRCYSNVRAVLGALRKNGIWFQSLPPLGCRSSGWYQ